MKDQNYSKDNQRLRWLEREKKKDALEVNRHKKKLIREIKKVNFLQLDSKKSETKKESWWTKMLKKIKGF
jgi:hypothetical protein|tara:strand:+ start:1034 stop:1243 length:210 start_codon:yes stop_codon:yes gene_type:complete